MIGFKTTEVFEGVGEREMELKRLSMETLAVFESACDAMRVETPSLETTSLEVVQAIVTEHDFCGVLCNYLKSFEEWRKIDSKINVTRIRHTLNGIGDCLEMLRNGDNGDDLEETKKKMESVEERQRKLLVLMGGKEALEGYDHNRSLRAAVSGAAGGGPSASGAAGGSAPESVFPRRMGHVTNLEMLYEILINPTFSLTEDGRHPEEDPTQRGITKRFHTAFWNSLADDMRCTPPCYTRVMRTIKEIHDGILGLGETMPQYNNFTVVEELVDLQLIKQRIQYKCFDWASCCKLLRGIENIFRSSNEPVVLGALQKLASRWSEVNETLSKAGGDMVLQPEALCNALQFLLDLTRKVRVGIANRRMANIKGFLLAHGIEASKDMVTMDVWKRGLLMNSTRRWLRMYVHLEIEGRRLDVDKFAADTPYQCVVVKQVITAAIVGLMEKGVRSSSAFPETMRFDAVRLRDMHERVKRDAVTDADIKLLSTIISVNRQFYEPVYQRIIFSEILLCQMVPQGSGASPLTINVIRLHAAEAVPTGVRLMRVDEVESEPWTRTIVHGWLQKWSIVRLDGGKIDGSGYGGKVTKGDFSEDLSIGEALVVLK